MSFIHGRDLRKQTVPTETMVFLPNTIAVEVGDLVIRSIKTQDGKVHHWSPVEVLIDGVKQNNVTKAKLVVSACDVPRLECERLV